jgi:hypothetical protein
MRITKEERCQLRLQINEFQILKVGICLNFIYMKGEGLFSFGENLLHRIPVPRARKIMNKFMY